MKTKVYTIGYAHHTQESFLKLLMKYDINCIIDVRTLAYSKFHPQFNKEVIKTFLNKHQILYKQMAKEFGIVREPGYLINNEGFLDLEKLAQTESFLKGIERIIQGIYKGFIIGFMCAEKSPLDCHRSTLVARALAERGFEVYHILYEGTLLTQKELEEALLEKYFPTSSQLDLFQTEKCDSELIKRAYRLRSNSIVDINCKRVFKKSNEHNSIKSTDTSLE